MRKLVYTTNCTISNGRDIEVLEDCRRQITYRTFRRLTDNQSARDLIASLGYNVSPGRKKGLRITNDPYVEFYKGTFRRKPCVEILWSQIDHIFT